MATPTAEEIALYEAQVGKAPVAINPLRDLSAEDIAALAVEDKTFSIPDEFSRQKELHGDAAFVQKAADALNAVNQRGFELKDLPTVKEAAGAVGTSLLGIGKQAWNYASAALNFPAGAIAELTGNEGLASGYVDVSKEALAKNIAGTEEGITGISQLAQKGIRKAGQATGIAKSFSEYTPAEKVTELFDKAGESEVREQRLTGRGAFTSAVTGEKRELNPEEVGTLAAGDPASFFLFGAGMGAAGKALKAVTPAVISGAVGRAASSVGNAAEAALPKVVGGGLTAAGVTAKVAAKGVEKGAPVVAPFTGAIVGGGQFGVSGVLGGVAVGERTGATIAAGAKFTGRQAGKLADIGRQVSGSTPIKSAYAQGARDFLQAIPGAAGEVAKGTALDIGLAAATAEVPQDTAGSVGFGTVLGAVGGAMRVAGRTLSGQLVAPRDYGANTVKPSSGQFRGLDAMHADAVKAASPGVRLRLNALRDFAEGVAPGTDVFLGRDAAAVEKALADAGVNPATAKAWSQAEGFFTADLPGRDGKPRRVVIARNVDSVPHEAQHVIQDVLGEQANQKIDAIVKEAYADRWDQEGQKYASRLTERGDPRNWREVLLDETGLGQAEAKEQVYRDIYLQLEAESGAPPSPRFVQELTKQEYGRRMDEAAGRGQPVEPDLIGRRVWREILSPEDVARVSDKYIARELAAENFDALFKNQGPRLQGGTQLPQRLARAVGNVMAALGGEPLAGRVSEFGRTPLSTPVIAAVRGAAKGLQGEQPQQPLVTPRVPAGPRPTPGTPDATDKAREIAAEAPDTALPGASSSQREILGKVADSIASKEGVRYNYRSAPDVPGAAEEAVRITRRAEIETARNLPEDLRRMTETTGFPYGVEKSKNGVVQVLDWSPDMLASNALRTARALAELAIKDPANPVLKKVKYELDVQNGEWTEQGWRDIFKDAETFSANQLAGFTGSGISLEVPKSTGRYAPPETGTPIGLDQTSADFQNLLYNIRVPQTPRQGKGMPGNLAAQAISEATLPGRLREPALVEPKMTKRAPFKGGEAILDPNPLRAEFETALQANKIPLPDGIEVVRRLNLEHIADVVSEPNLPRTAGGNTMTLTAGLQPRAQLAARTDTGRQVAEERGFEIRHTGTPENPGVAMFKDGAPVGEISAVRNSAIEADIDNIKVNQGFRGQGLSEILYREMGKRLQDEGVETVTGMIIDKRALAGRSKVFPETKVENEITVGEGAPAYEVRSPISATAQFSPPELAARVEKFSPKEFRAWVASPEGANFTGIAHDVGLKAPDQAFVDSLMQRYDAISKRSLDLRAGLREDPATMLDKLDDMSALASQGQFFREAYEAATGTASAGLALRKDNPNFKPPFPIEAKVQLAPKAPKTKEEVQKMLGDEVVRMAANHPEALPLDYQKNKDGTFKLDKENVPTPLSKNYELHDTPLAKRAVAGIEGKEAQKAAIIDAYATKIEEAYAQAAKNPAILAGKDWYELTRKKLKKLFGVDTKLFAEILGATSANTPVDTNFRFAIDAYNKFKAGDYNAAIAKYKEGKAIWDSGDLSAARALDTKNFLGESPTRAKFREFWIKHHDLKPKQSNGKLFGFNSGAVLRVFDGSWRAEIDAPKTPNFADNLSGDSFEATIDIWAARLMRRLGHEGSEAPWRILAKNETGVTDKDFFMAQEAFRKAGDKVGVSPDALQAIVWFLEKDLWDTSGWTKEVGAKKSDFNAFLDITTRAEGAGKLTINEIRTKPGAKKVKPEVTVQLAPEKSLVVESKKPSVIVAMPQEDAEKIADAIYKAEGGAKAKKPYGILSVKVSGEAEARKVALNTIKNNYKRWQVAGKPGGYLEFLAGKYAPIGVANDPKSLNKNWLKNVKAGLAK